MGAVALAVDSDVVYCPTRIAPAVGSGQHRVQISWVGCLEVAFAAGSPSETGTVRSELDAFR